MKIFAVLLALLATLPLAAEKPSPKPPNRQSR
jgi:hypothetical protein